MQGAQRVERGAVQRALAVDGTHCAGGQLRHRAAFRIGGSRAFHLDARLAVQAHVIRHGLAVGNIVTKQQGRALRPAPVAGGQGGDGLARGVDQTRACVIRGQRAGGRALEDRADRRHGADLPCALGIQIAIAHGPADLQPVANAGIGGVLQVLHAGAVGRYDPAVVFARGGNGASLLGGYLQKALERRQRAALGIEDGGGAFVVFTLPAGLHHPPQLVIDARDAVMACRQDPLPLLVDHAHAIRAQ
ncbi:hypothetical protein G6F35_013629 [Rhizopus arrhizus]|nr:hypothetical protein G6F35_013629 [Rhizopus arrhizus]